MNEINIHTHIQPCIEVTSICGRINNLIDLNSSTINEKILEIYFKSKIFDMNIFAGRCNGMVLGKTKKKSTRKDL